jgi:hypothetical protein
MKKFIQSLAIFIAFCVHTNANQSVKAILSVPETKLAVYTEDESGLKLKLNMNYGSAVILNPDDISVLKNAKIGTVDVICTDDPAGALFTGLIESRIESVQKIFPHALDDGIRWRFFRQTGCADRSSAEKMFHGVVITYRPEQTKETMKCEIEYLSALIPDIEEPQEVKHSETISKKPKRASKESGAVTIVRSDLRSNDDVLVTISYTELRGDTAFVESRVTDKKGSKSYAMKFVPFVDSTVSAVLNRQHWTDMCITADVTGSMSPYTAQLLLWLNLNTIDGKTKQFVFFNDGDMKPDKAKVIGKTGGIYSGKFSDLPSVKNLAVKAMSNGSGGDAPENDLEALRESIKMNPDGEQILIADNWAPLKDYSLIGDITRPVRIVLCGTQWGVNVDYLNLARATGGSVHTMENDLLDLAKMNEGEEVSIGRETFKISKGKFVKIVHS